MTFRGATASPAIVVAPIVVATSEPGNVADPALLAELSHVDPDSNPLRHSQIWARIQRKALA